MKKIKITKHNIEQFAEHMFQFNSFNQYNSKCFSTNDIIRERKAFHVTDILLEQLDKAGFDMSTIKAFKNHNWRVDDLTAPVLDNPVLIIESTMYETYFDAKNITEYYTDDDTTDCFKPEELLIEKYKKE